MVKAFQICEKIKYDRHYGIDASDIEESFLNKIKELESIRDEFIGIEEVLGEIKNVLSEDYISHRESY